MAFTQTTVEIASTSLLFLALLSFPGAVTSVDCRGKPFYCENSTHFKICVDFGNGVSNSVDDFVIPCPSGTECSVKNHFECEYLPPTTPAAVPLSSEAPIDGKSKDERSLPTSVWEVVTTNLPVGSPHDKEFSEKYLVTEATPTSADNVGAPVTTDEPTTVMSTTSVPITTDTNSEVNITIENDDFLQEIVTEKIFETVIPSDNETVTTNLQQDTTTFLTTINGHESTTSLNTEETTTVTSVGDISTPNVAISTPSEVVSTPSEVISKPIEVISKPSEVITTPSEVISKPIEVISKPSEVITTPSEVISTPSEVVSTPSEVVSTPSEVISKPIEVISKPSEVITTPSEVISTPSEVFSTTSEVFSTTSEVFSTTSEIFTTSSEIFTITNDVIDVITTPSEILTTPIEVITKPSEEGSTTLQEITATSPENTQSTMSILDSNNFINEIWLDVNESQKSTTIHDDIHTSTTTRQTPYMSTTTDRIISESKNTVNLVNDNDAISGYNFETIALADKRDSNLLKTVETHITVDDFNMEPEANKSIILIIIPDEYDTTVFDNYKNNTSLNTLGSEVTFDHGLINKSNIIEAVGSNVPFLNNNTETSINHSEETIGTKVYDTTLNNEGINVLTTTSRDIYETTQIPTKMDSKSSTDIPETTLAQFLVQENDTSKIHSDNIVDTKPTLSSIVPENHTTATSDLQNTIDNLVQEDFIPTISYENIVDTKPTLSSIVQEKENYTTTTGEVQNTIDNKSHSDSEKNFQLLNIGLENNPLFEILGETTIGDVQQSTESVTVPVGGMSNDYKNNVYSASVTIPLSSNGTNFISSDFQEVTDAQGIINDTVSIAINETQEKIIENLKSNQIQDENSNKSFTVIVLPESYLNVLPHTDNHTEISPIEITTETAVDDNLPNDQDTAKGEMHSTVATKENVLEEMTETVLLKYLKTIPNSLQTKKIMTTEATLLSTQSIFNEEGNIKNMATSEITPHETYSLETKKIITTNEGGNVEDIATSNVTPQESLPTTKPYEVIDLFTRYTTNAPSNEVTSKQDANESSKNPVETSIQPHVQDNSNGFATLLLNQDNNNSPTKVYTKTTEESNFGSLLSQEKTKEFISSTSSYVVSNSDYVNVSLKQTASESVTQSLPSAVLPSLSNKADNLKVVIETVKIKEDSNSTAIKVEATETVAQIPGSDLDNVPVTVTVKTLAENDQNKLVNSSMPVTNIVRKDEDDRQSNIYNKTLIAQNKTEIKTINQQEGDLTTTNTNKTDIKSFNCTNKIRGRYSDEHDCKKFYICIDSHVIIGYCPNNTVFSKTKKQCTKNVSHCIMQSEFQCQAPGRFIDYLSENVYYICVPTRQAFVRFKFQCQKGFYLHKEYVKCLPDIEILRFSQSESYDNASNKDSYQVVDTKKSNQNNHSNTASASDKENSEAEEESERLQESQAKRRSNDKEKVKPKKSNEKSRSKSVSESYNENSEAEEELERLQERQAKRRSEKYQSKSVSKNNSEKSEAEATSESETKEKSNKRERVRSNDSNNKKKRIRCVEEGKFPHPSDCRKFYICYKNKKSVLRRKRSKCDSDEVFNNDKKKCVDADSYECQL